MGALPNGETDRVLNKSSNTAAHARPFLPDAMKRVLTLATDQHKLDDGQQFLEVDRLADDFLRMQ